MVENIGLVLSALLGELDKKIGVMKGGCDLFHAVRGVQDDHPTAGVEVVDQERPSYQQRVVHDLVAVLLDFFQVEISSLYGKMDVYCARENVVAHTPDVVACRQDSLDRKNGFIEALQHNVPILDQLAVFL